MTDIDTSLVKEIFDIPQRKWKSDVQYHGYTDDLGTGFEVMEEAGLVIPKRYAKPLPRSSKVNLT